MQKAPQNRYVEYFPIALGVGAIGIFMFWGGWTRRWMSDDGLIVLRTVRNLLAGNGPVFNVGERVEANTSTIWQYVIYIGARITGADLHRISIGSSLFFSVLALMIAVFATSMYYKKRGFNFVVPFGALIYVALPPARDFATSGLEWGLSIFYLATFWWLSGTQRKYLFALWLGIGWLVRPEMLLYSVIFGAWLFWKTRDWRIFAAALPLPVGYEIFRMGYYGLVVPHTAVAKSASSSDWAGGLSYLWDFVGTYALYLLIPVVIIALIACKLDSVAILMMLAGTLHVFYVIKVGGDFMHGRMLLLPLFALLLPLMAIPIQASTLWRNGLATIAIAVWAIVTVIHGHAYERPQGAAAQAALKIVDEREYWTQTLQRDIAPRHARDFLTAPAMRDFQSTIKAGQENNSAYLFNYVIDSERDLLSWGIIPREARNDRYPLSLMHLNLGMTSMNAGLDVRVHDSVGLSTPLAARQPKIEDGRIGHNKHLPLEWELADSSADPSSLPPGVDREEVERIRAMLAHGDAAELLASYREPMSIQRFFKNIKFSLTTGLTLQFDKFGETVTR